MTEAFVPLRRSRRIAEKKEAEDAILALIAKRKKTKEAVSKIVFGTEKNLQPADIKEADTRLQMILDRDKDLRQRLFLTPIKINQTVIETKQPIVTQVTKDIKLSNIEELLESQDIPSWQTWKDRASHFSGTVLRSGTSIIVGAGLSSALGPVGGALLTPIATRTVINTGKAVISTSRGLSRKLMRGTGISLEKSGIGNAGKKRVETGGRIRVREKKSEELAQSRLSNYISENAIAVVGGAVSNAAASAIATAAIFGTLDGTLLNEFSKVGVGAAITYSTGDYTYFLSGVKGLATSKFAQNIGFQFVASKIGWDKIGGFIGKQIHEALKGNGKLQNSILSESQKETISRYIYDSPDWLKTTWEEIISGLSQDSLQAASFYAASEVGSAVLEVAKGAIEYNLGSETISDLLIDSYNQAFIATSKSLTQASEAASNSAVQISQALKDGIKSGYEAFFGTSSGTVSLETTDLRQGFERINSENEARKLSITTARLEANQRYLSRKQLRVEKQNQISKQIDESRQKTLDKNYKLLGDKREIGKLAFEFATKQGGSIASASILSQGLTFEALGPQFLQFLVGKLQIGRQVAANIGISIVGNETVDKYVFDRLSEKVESGELEDSSDLTTVMSEITNEVYINIASQSLNVAQIIGLKYDIARTMSIMSANLIELAGFSANSQSVQDYASTSRDYVSMLPTSGAIRDYFANVLGVEKETALVDVNQIVLQVIFEKYLNPFSYKSNAEIASDVIDAVSWGNENESNQLRENAHEAVTFILENIEQNLK